MNVGITLHQYASSNSVLQSLQKADEDDDGNTWVVSCTIKDVSGQTLFFSDQTIIASTPDVTLSTTTETRDWSLFMFNSDNFVGGNTQMGESEVSAIEALGMQVDARWQING